MAVLRPDEAGEAGDAALQRQCSMANWSVKEGPMKFVSGFRSNSESRIHRQDWLCISCECVS